MTRWSKTGLGETLKFMLYSIKEDSSHCELVPKPTAYHAF